jgi:protein TonB|uniref:Energy transducer TonB n=1 Tax=candidate division WOR-3 bacterium TaxID=2052148 RepID=A0A7C4TGI0_UNCW3
MKDHKLMYGVYLRSGLLLGIILSILLFLFVPYAEVEPYKLKKEIVTMVEQISAEIEKYEEPPPVERPKVAVAASVNEVSEEEAVETIASTEFQEDIIRTQPTGPEIEIVPYYKVEVKPQPVYLPAPEYPELARKAGIEGKVTVHMLVDIDGSVIDVKVIQSSGNQILDEAAVSCARKSKFTPAKQRDKLVRVWVSRRIEFKLK